MAYKLIDIPNHKLDFEINKFLKESSEATIAVSFIFVSGLKLIYPNLEEFCKYKKLTIVTSNYLSSTQPEALKMLLKLQDLGANIYFYDSIKSNTSFHLKSYAFSNKKNNNLIIGSSNLSITAFQKGYELNLLSDDKSNYHEFQQFIKSIIINEFTSKLSEEVIAQYESIYDESQNIFIKIPKDLNITALTFKEPNIFQKDALDILISDREMGIKRGLIVMATGLGKTILAALDALNFQPKKLLFIAHREEILNQSLNTFKNFFPNKSLGFYQGSKKEINSDYLFASIMTIGKKSELSKFNPNEFDYIIVDEFHHAGAKSYRNLLEYFTPKFFLGLTATPNRSDNVDILQYLDNNLLYRKDLVDGVNMGELSSFSYHGINDKYVDYTKITWRGNKFDEQELDSSLNSTIRAQYIFENWSNLKLTRTLAFCSSIKHSDFMSNFFNTKGVKSLSVHSRSDTNRNEAINKLKTNEIDILFSVDLFNEGVDIPVVDTILMLRPTESKIIFLQQFGRGLRKAHGKNIVNVIDFIGNHKSFLEKPSALFGFDLNFNNIHEFIKNYKNGNLKLPKDSRVLYDTESITFMEKLIEMKQDFISKYKEYKDNNNIRPSASEFYQFIDKLSQLRLQYTSWFNFINKMEDLNPSEIDCLNKNSDFLLEIEQTKMTKSFKMVVLDILCKNDFKSMDIDKLSADSFDYLKQTTNLWNEVLPEFKLEKLSNDLKKKWVKYWTGNPIKALTETSSKFFKLNNNHLEVILNDDIDKTVFKNMCKELIQYRFLSYKISYDLSYVELGNFDKTPDEQIGKAFNKTDVPKLFKFQGEAASEGYYKMFGHARPPNTPHQFIYITLIKSSMAFEHRYQDFFKSDKIFHWQSRNSTRQDNDAGLAVTRHLANKEKIHLFVRKMQTINGKTLPFTYCGEIDFLSVEGNAPINVDFKLQHPLNNKLKQEFLRI